MWRLEPPTSHRSLEILECLTDNDPFVVLRCDTRRDPQRIFEGRARSPASLRLVRESHDFVSRWRDGDWLGQPFGCVDHLGLRVVVGTHGSCGRARRQLRWLRRRCWRLGLGNRLRRTTRPSSPTLISNTSSGAVDHTSRVALIPTTSRRNGIVPSARHKATPAPPQGATMRAA